MDTSNKNITNINPVMDILGINTDTENISGIKSAQEYYIKLAKKMGFDAILCAEDINGNKRVIEIRPKNQVRKKSKLGLVVHLDTVPIGEGWKHNPYGEIDENGRVYGRGVIDNKAPAIETLQVMYLLRDYISPDWLIICGSSEETEWADMEAYLNEKRENAEELPDFSITIDGDGVQNGCRGYLDLKLIFDRQEPTCKISQFFTSEDAANNSVPGSASAVIDGLEKKSVGKACHSSIPQNGVNAIIKLAEEIMAENPEAYAEFKNFFDLIKKMGESFDSAETLFFKKRPYIINGQNVGYTSSCPTTCKLDNNKISVNLNIRLMVGTTMEEVNEAINKICETYNCKAEISKINLPAFIPIDTPSIKKLLEAYEEELGKATKSEIASGIGYNAAIPRCAIFGPRWATNHDEEDTCHSADESRTIKDIVIFMNMLSRFVKKEIPLPETERIKEELLKMQSDETYRKVIKNNSREYTPTEINMMAEMLLSSDFTPPNETLLEEKKVIEEMKKFDQEGIYLSLTPEQLAFIVNEAIVSYKLCNTSLTLEQFIKVSPSIFLLMIRYNDESSKVQGLINGDKINDTAFLSILREKKYTSLELEKISEKLKSVHTPIVTEDSYSRIDD